MGYLPGGSRTGPKFVKWLLPEKVQGFHLLRNTGGASREVRLVRTKRTNMRFPRLP